MGVNRHLLRRAAAPIACLTVGLLLGLLLGRMIWHRPDQWAYHSAFRGQPCRINLRNGELHYLTLDGEWCRAKELPGRTWREAPLVKDPPRYEDTDPIYSDIPPGGVVEKP
jgi:hypothetical protein